MMVRIVVSVAASGSSLSLGWSCYTLSVPLGANALSSSFRPKEKLVKMVK